MSQKKGYQKLYFCPVLDYDLSFDNDGRLIPTNEKPKFSLYYGDSADSTRDFFIDLLKKNIIDRKNLEWIKIKLNLEDLKSFIKKEYLKKVLILIPWYGMEI